MQQQTDSGTNPPHCTAKQERDKPMDTPCKHTPEQPRRVNEQILRAKERDENEH